MNFFVLYSRHGAVGGEALDPRSVLLHSLLLVVRLESQVYRGFEFADAERCCQDARS